MTDTIDSKVIIGESGKFKILYNLPKDINVVVCIGGRGGRKTYEVSKFVAKSASIDKKRCVILRDEKETIRESILNDILKRFDHANQYGHLTGHCERLDTGIKDKETGDMLVFSKGFRASSNEKKANLKGVSDIDIAVIEEAEDIRDQDKFNVFHDSLRKKGSLIIIILNTPEISHWVIKRYFNCVVAKDDNGVPLDGFYEIVPKEIEGFLCIKADYEDNQYLPEHVTTRYKAYGNPESHLYNPFYYYTAIKGYASTGRKGQVLTKAKPIKLSDYLALPYKEIYGLDFGTASPAGIIGVKVHRNQLWARQLNYKPMSTLEIGKFFCEKQMSAKDLIVADSAEPKSIKKLKDGWRGEELPDDEFMKYPLLSRGFNVIEAIKGPGSIEFGIGLLVDMDLYIVEESTDFWTEIHSWVYAQDKNKNYTDQPIDDHNHLIDPLRYVLMEIKSKGPKKYFGYSIE